MWKEAAVYILEVPFRLFCEGMRKSAELWNSRRFSQNSKYAPCEYNLEKIQLE
jgi:hypothetical protein